MKLHQFVMMLRYMIQFLHHLLLLQVHCLLEEQQQLHKLRLHQYFHLCYLHQSEHCLCVNHNHQHYQQLYRLLSIHCIYCWYLNPMTMLVNKLLHYTQNQHQEPNQCNGVCSQQVCLSSLLKQMVDK